MDLVLRESRAKGRDRLVLFSIAYANGAPDTTLARYARCTEQAVRQSVVRLVAMGELAVEQTDGRPRYTILLSWPTSR
jgi:hypothetical protein